MRIATSPHMRMEWTHPAGMKTALPDGISQVEVSGCHGHRAGGGVEQLAPGMAVRGPFKTAAEDRAVRARHQERLLFGGNPRRLARWRHCLSI